MGGKIDAEASELHDRIDWAARYDNHPGGLLTTSRFFSSSSSSLSAAIGFLLTTTALSAQETPREPTFFDTIDVQIVNLEVIVTDEDGRPVHGLTRDDFEIVEDGQPVEITNFFAMAEGRPAESIFEKEPEALDPGSEAPALAAPENQQLHLLVFVDNLNLAPIHRNRILGDVRDFIDRRMQANDRVMVVSYDGELTIHLEPTDRAELVIAALDEISTGSTRGQQSAQELKRLLEDIDQASVFDQRTESFGSEDADKIANNLMRISARTSFAEIRNYAQMHYAEAQRTVGHVKQLIDSLTTLDGRKTFLYVSQGISLNPGQALLEVWEDKFGNLVQPVNQGAVEILSLETGPLVQEMAEHASSNRVTFYAIGGGGEISSSLAEYGFGSGDTGGGRRLWTSSYQTLESTNRMGSLEVMAATTGGLVAHGDSAIESTLRNVHSDLDNYYSLAYVPSRQRDGNRHQVKVKVRQQGLQIRHREGYRSRTVEEEMQARTRSAMLLGGENNPLRVVVDFGNEQENEKGQFVVPVMVKIPLGRIVLLPQPDFHEGRLSIFVGARDAKGGESEILKTEVPIRIPNDQVMNALSRVGGYGMNLLMRSGRHRVAVTVRDEIGKTQSVVTTDYTPGRLVVGLPAGG